VVLKFKLAERYFVDKILSPAHLGGQEVQSVVVLVVLLVVLVIEGLPQSVGLGPVRLDLISHLTNI
jgi:hypothetical protein